MIDVRFGGDISLPEVR